MPYLYNIELFPLPYVSKSKYVSKFGFYKVGQSTRYNLYNKCDIIFILYADIKHIDFYGLTYLVLGSNKRNMTVQH